jgi:hypothetical protein
MSPRHRRDPAKRPQRGPQTRFKILQYLTSFAVPLVIVAFVALYHVVLPSDDVTSVQVLRKERPAFRGTLVFVPRFVEDYNRAEGDEQEAIEKTYLYRRLLEVGIVRRSD